MGRLRFDYSVLVSGHRDEGQVEGAGSEFLILILFLVILEQIALLETLDGEHVIGEFNFFVDF